MLEIEERSEAIKPFLLGQLDEAAAQQIEYRIFAEPDFAEAVRVLESELIADYLQGALSQAERKLFEAKYIKNRAGVWEVQYETIFREFARKKLTETEPLAAARAGLAKNTPAMDERRPAKQSGPLTRAASVFGRRPALTYAAFTLGLVIVIGVAIYWTTHSPKRNSGADLLQAERSAAEAELSQLNNEAASSPVGRDVTAADLQPAQRAGGSMPRLVIHGDRSSDIVELRLNLLRSVRPSYRALVLDDQQNELFAISHLSPRNTMDGPQVWLFVYAKYLKGGDYQIDLSSLKPDGTYEAEWTYTFRVIDGR